MSLLDGDVRHTVTLPIDGSEPEEGTAFCPARLGPPSKPVELRQVRAGAALLPLFTSQPASTPPPPHRGPATQSPIRGLISTKGFQAS